MLVFWTYDQILTCYFSLILKPFGPKLAAQSYLGLQKIGNKILGILRKYINIIDIGAIKFPLR